MDVDTTRIQRRETPGESPGKADPSRRDIDDRSVRGRDRRPGVDVRRPSAAGGYLVHLFTASGVVFAFLAAAEVCSAAPDPRMVFLYLAIQVLIDAADGPLARRFDVKRTAPRIDGRTIDDIVDYLTYTFIPLLLIWRMNWAGPWGISPAFFVAPAMVASLFGFANTGAKDEARGFFLGFPSYWNIVALYAGIAHHEFGPDVGGAINAGMILLLGALTVLPVRFVYPNLAPRPWRWPTLLGAVIWTILMGVMLVSYPRVGNALLLASLVYPALYVVLSLWLDHRTKPVPPPARL